jgi:amidase
VGVSAGYAPFAIGTDTAGSIIHPAGRAALYAMKPSVGLISTSGIVPVTKFFDSPGPMAKSAIDVALLLDVLVDTDKNTIPEGKYVSAATGKWDGLRIGTLDPEKWTLTPDIRKILDPSAEEQLVWSIQLKQPSPF